MLHIRILFLAILLISTIALVFGENDDSVCKFGNDGDLAAQLNAQDFYSELSPFGRKLFDAIPSEGFFHKLFNASFQPSETKIFFDNCINYSVQMGLNCPIVLCKGVGASGEKAVGNGLTELKYFRVIANTLEDSLKEEGQLYSDSAEDMIRSFLKNVARYLYSNGYEGATGALTALVNGAVKFFTSVGVTCLKDSAYIAQAFGEQMGKAAEDS